jgi:hypothetical protein
MSSYYPLNSQTGKATDFAFGKFLFAINNSLKSSTLGANMELDWKTKESKLVIGLSHKLDSGDIVKAKVDQFGFLSALYKTNIGKSKIWFGSKFNLHKKTFEKADPNCFGVGLELNL